MSPSSIVSENSEVSELSPLSTPQIPEIDIAQGLIISNIDIPNATIYDTAFQCENNLHLKINLPGANKLPKPGLNTKNHHTYQDDDSNSSHSEDHENNPGYGYSYTDPVPEYPPEIQNNIRIMGTHMVTHMCPPFSIHLHLSPRYIPKHAQI